ncbi:Diacylglycerol O-acyltransferase 2A [Cyphellophora attinorum]|uniref:Diacylglycerol O-acyltransferase n=1 Tax=Cyphellophora attinorum TaxID=1664694 RepID=A0A0N1P014_9EURO|nr:Diacylglycerol O-acyltransferase 2A [Phialophora attinorum]KPI39525.1 Diacylglycerol O-acyltransferase 2A [Phialophora attinorum]
MAATTSTGPLSDEPANPEVREELSLPPKSYADAAHAGLDDDKHEARRLETVLTAVTTEIVETTVATTLHKTTLLSTEEYASAKDGWEDHASSNGSTLVTVDTDNKEEKEQKSQSNAPLESGRQAGAGWGRSAIRWAPLNVPLQRRLQTMAVLWHSLSIVTMVGIFFLCLAFPPNWIWLVPYLLYIVFSDAHMSGTLRRRSNWLRRQKVWSLFASYFPARLHRTVQLERHRKYIFGYHPHGIISHGAFAAFATEAMGFAELFPGITNTLLTLDANFRLPFYREYALAMGLASVSKESIENLLSKGGPNGSGMGRAVTIVVGGAKESLMAKPYHLRLILNIRKGFVKIAIRQGADLVPVLAFGENDIYEQVDSNTHPWLYKFQIWVKWVAGFTIPLFHARGIFNYDVGLMPYRRPINLVVGRPIEVHQPQDGIVTDAYLDEIHGKYVKELQRIWDDHKEQFSPQREEELTIQE